MSELQQEAANIVVMLPPKDNRRMQAFERLDAAREEIRHYLPDDFDLEKELEEARAERFGSICEFLKVDNGSNNEKHMEKA